MITIDIDISAEDSDDHHHQKGQSDKGHSDKQTS